jgi:hypothetical protein
MIWLGIALLPYVALAGIDAWLHEKARKVPRIEQMLHATAAVSLFVFVGAAFGARSALAAIALGVFAVVTFADEFGYHGHLAARERRIHFAAYAALLVFVLAWRWQEAGS